MNDNGSLEIDCSGTEQGRFLIKCNDCQNLSSCDISSQIWLPYTCTYRSLDQSDLQKCLKDKNVSFLSK